MHGADYFVNAGSTKQLGIESYLSWQIISNANQSFTNCKVWISHTWNDFSYKDFKQVATDYSGRNYRVCPKCGSGRFRY
jgi:iron complex outermembrane receptor protein